MYIRYIYIYALCMINTLSDVRLAFRWNSIQVAWLSSVVVGASLVSTITPPYLTKSFVSVSCANTRHFFPSIPIAENCNAIATLHGQQFIVDVTSCFDSIAQSSMDFSLDHEFPLWMYDIANKFGYRRNSYGQFRFNFTNMSIQKLLPFLTTQIPFHYVRT